PSGTVQTKYDRLGRTQSIDADLPGRPATPFVTNVDYDAKARRHQIGFGHGGTTTYGYDPLTFNLDTITTERSGTTYQALVYAYDPLGNITGIRDDAQDAIYFGGNVIKPQRDYTYDALYRLASAIGREHLSQAAPD